MFGFLFPNAVYATNSAGLVNGIWFDKTPIVASIPVKVFSVVHNQRNKSLNGIVTLMVDGTAVGAQEVTVARESIKRVAIAYTFSTGIHSVGIYFTANDGVESTMTALSIRQITVDSTPRRDLKNETNDSTKSVNGGSGTSPLTEQVTQKTHALTTVGKELVTQILGEGKASPKEEAHTKNSTSRATSASFFQTVDTTRVNIATAAKQYEKQQREILRTLTNNTASTKKTTGFSTEKSKLKEYQIAAAGAAAIGFLFDKKWMFYLELIVLTLGVMHLIAVSMRAKAARRRALVDKEEDEWE